MNALTQELLKKIEEASTARELDGWIWKVGDLIAKSSHKEYHSGFLEIDSIEVSPEESEILKLALLEALKRSSDPSFVSQILNSLIMTLDPNLKTLPLLPRALFAPIERLQPRCIFGFGRSQSIGRGCIR